MATELFYKVFEGAGMCECTGGAVLLWAENQTAEGLAKLRKALENNKYLLYTEREENGNLFTTYTKKNEVITAYFTPCDSKVRMIFEEGAGLPPREQDNRYAERVSPMVTQLKTGNLKRDCGMSYLIRLCDGRFVLIDSQFDEYEETERLLDTLREQNTVFEKPVFAACFFTHPHDDHIDAFVRLMKDYADEVVFGDIIYNWASPEKLPYEVETVRFDDCVQRVRGVNIIKARSGQRFCYADAVLDMLYVCDDLYPQKLMHFNSSSLVMRMEMEGRRFMWTGDMMYDSSCCITARYGKESLKSEFLQVPHHGYWGGSEEINRLIEPEVLLWSVPDFRYKWVLKIPKNAVLFETGKVKEVFVSGRYQTVIDVRKPIPDAPPAPEFAEGETIFSSDFNKRIIDLGWSAVTCGGTDFKGADLELKDGRCLWTAEGKTMLEIVNAFTLEKVESYTVDFSGRVLKKPAEFGFVFNNPTPTEWRDELFVPLDVREGDFTCQLILDGKKRNAVLVYNGGVAAEREYLPEIDSGLYFVLKNGETEIDKIVVKRQ